MEWDQVYPPLRHGDSGLGHALDSLSRREMAMMIGIVLGIFTLLLLIGLQTR